MSQNYPPYGGGDDQGQGRGQGPGFRRRRDRRRNHTRGVRQDQRDAVEAEDFFAPREPEREPVYRYGDRYFPTEQDARRQRDQPASLHNHQQPLHEPREYNNDFLGPYEEEPVHYRRPQPTEQISGYGYQGSHYPPEQVPGYGYRGSQNPIEQMPSYGYRGTQRPPAQMPGYGYEGSQYPPEQMPGYGYRGSQNPLEHYPRYGDRGNQPPPLTPGQLYGRNQRGFTPPGQSSNSQHGESSYHGPHPHMPPVRVPQAQNRPPIQAPSRDNTQITLPSQIRRDSIDTVDRSRAGGELTNSNSNSRKRKFTAHRADQPETSGGVNDMASNHGTNTSNTRNTSKGGDNRQSSFSCSAGQYSGYFDNVDAAFDALKQTAKPGQGVEMSWRYTSKSKEDPRIKRRRIQELESTIVSRPLFELLPPATPEEQARIDRARAARAARLQAINAVPNIPAQPAGPSCGNCKSDSHVVAKCNKPQSDGLIHGCAICNADDHSTWACGEFPRGDGKELDQLRELVFKRMNQPPLQGKHWYPLMYSYMQAHPFTEVPGLPWTTEFSQPYHKDSRLQDTLRFQIENDELETADPKTRTWQDAVAHYWDPRQWRSESESKTKQ